MNPDKEVGMVYYDEDAKGLHSSPDRTSLVQIRLRFLRSVVASIEFFLESKLNKARYLSFCRFALNNSW